MFEHEPVRTSEEAAKVRPGYTIEQGAKAIILKVRTDSPEPVFVMLVIPGHKRFNKTSVKQFLNAKDMTFATEDLVLELTGGVLPGGIPPFGNIFGLRTIADPEIFKQDKISFNAGDRAVSVGMLSEDYKRLVNPEIRTIAE